MGVGDEVPLAVLIEVVSQQLLPAVPQSALGPLDVVDADVVAEDGARVRVGLFDWRPGEADEGRVGKCICRFRSVCCTSAKRAASTVGGCFPLATMPPPPLARMRPSTSRGLLGYGRSNPVRSSATT